MNWTKQINSLFNSINYILQGDGFYISYNENPKKSAFVANNVIKGNTKMLDLGQITNPLFALVREGKTLSQTRAENAQVAIFQLLKIAGLPTM